MRCHLNQIAPYFFIGYDIIGLIVVFFLSKLIDLRNLVVRCTSIILKFSRREAPVFRHHVTILSVGRIYSNLLFRGKLRWPTRSDQKRHIGCKESGFACFVCVYHIFLCGGRIFCSLRSKLFYARDKSIQILEAWRSDSFIKTWSCSC